MKSKEEIEEYLGIKIESSIERDEITYGEEYRGDTIRYMPITGEKIIVDNREYRYSKVLSEESENALKNLLKESIDKGDLETASTCHTILMEESTFYKNHPNAIGLDLNQGILLTKYEEQQKLIAEKARIQAEKEAQAKVEEQVKIKAEQEAQTKAEEQARIKAEQEAQAKVEEQAKIKAEQEAQIKAEKRARIKAEQETQAKQEKNMLEQKYGLAGVQDRETLQRRLEEIVSKGIFLGADKDNDKKVAEFEKMKQVIPRFEEFKNVYLQLRQAGIEDELYTYMNFENVSFNDLLERATMILEERAKAEEQKAELEQQETIIEDEHSELETDSEQVAVGTIEYEPSVPKETIIETPTGTETSIEIDDNSMMDAHLEYMRNHQTQQISQVVEDYWNEIHSQQAKVYEQQQPEKIRPREKSIKDEVGDELKATEKQVQKQEKPTVDLWMNRFNSWYSSIDRVSQNVKAKFVKMKSDIVKAISNTLKERMNKREQNEQRQDSNER